MIIELFSVQSKQTCRLNKKNETVIRKIFRSLWIRARLLTNYYNLKLGKSNIQRRLGENRHNVFFDLKDLGLESYYCYLILSFIEHGFKVSIRDNLWFLANCRTHLNTLLRNYDVAIIRRPSDCFITDCFFIYDLPSSLSKLQWQKIIHINIDIYSPKRGTHLNMPYQMSPHIYLSNCHLDVNSLRKEHRSMRIFFSGNQDVQAYGSPIFELYFLKMSRLEVLEEVRARLDDSKLSHEIPSLSAGGYANKMVLLDWSWSPKKAKDLNRRVDNSEWLFQLAHSHFFLCPPGIRTPLCHHTIESMAVGTIPILEYPELFDPPLVHMENAIVFSGANDLIEKIDLVLSMEESIIRKVSKKVIDYYDSFLQIPWISEQILEVGDRELELYINGEEKSYSQEMLKLI